MSQEAGIVQEDNIIMVDAFYDGYGVHVEAFAQYMVESDVNIELEVCAQNYYGGGISCIDLTATIPQGEGYIIEDLKISEDDF